MNQLLLNKPTNELTKQERDYLKNELNEMDKNEIRRELELLVNRQKQQDAKIELIDENLTKLQKNTNVLGSPIHSKRCLLFRKLCNARVYEFLTDPSTDDYQLFAPFYFKKIYADIANHFELNTYKDINMEDYENENSPYGIAKRYAEVWYPSSYYTKECLKQLIDKRDKGLLKRERCVALTEYLKTHDF